MNNSKKNKMSSDRRSIPDLKNGLFWPAIANISIQYFYTAYTCIHVGLSRLVLQRERCLYTNVFVLVLIVVVVNTLNLGFIHTPTETYTMHISGAKR